MNPLQPKHSSTIWKHLGAGVSLAVSILLCIWVGYGVDSHWGTKPWGVLIGACLGIGVGLFNFFKEFTDETKRSG